MSDANNNDAGNSFEDAKLEAFPPVDSFQNVPSLVLRDLRPQSGEAKGRLEHLDIAVYALLKAHARMKGECHPSIERVAKLAACSASTVQRSLKRLDCAGHIQRKSHIKGKIFLLTDVTATGQIKRRNRIIFPTTPRSIRSMTPPKVQDMTRVTSWQGAQSETPLEVETVNWESEDDRPF